MPMAITLRWGLHVFFNNYYNLFALAKKVGAFENLLPKEHVHTFVNRGGVIKELDFRFLLGAPFHGLKAFFYHWATDPARQIAERDRFGHESDCAGFNQH